MGVKRANRTLLLVSRELYRCSERIDRAANDPGLTDENKAILEEFKSDIENAHFRTPALLNEETVNGD